MLLSALENVIRTELLGKVKSNDSILLFSGGIRSLSLLHFMHKEKIPGLQVVHIHSSIEPDQLIEYITKMERFLNIVILTIESHRNIENGSTILEKVYSTMKAEPSEYPYSDFSKVKIIIGSNGNVRKHLPDQFNIDFNESNIIAPLLNIPQDIIMKYLLKEGVPLCSLYNFENITIDSANLSQKLTPCSSTALQDEIKIKENLRKLGYL